MIRIRSASSAAGTGRSWIAGASPKLRTANARMVRSLTLTSRLRGFEQDQLPTHYTTEAGARDKPTENLPQLSARAREAGFADHVPDGRKARTEGDADLLGAELG